MIKFTTWLKTRIMYLSLIALNLYIVNLAKKNPFIINTNYISVKGAREKRLPDTQILEVSIKCI